MEPVKCPDCGTWWRGEEHRCPSFYLDGATVVSGGGASRDVTLGAEGEAFVHYGSGRGGRSTGMGRSFTVTTLETTVTYPPDDEPPQRAGALV